MKNLFFVSIFICGAFSITAQNCPGGGGGSTQTISTSVTQSFGATSVGNGNSFGSLTGNQSFGNLLAQTQGLSQGQTNQIVYDNLDGSPYLNDEPTKGTLVLNDGRKVEDILLQVDLHTNQAIATLESGEEIFLDSRFFKEISLEHDGELVVLKKTNPDRPDRFYQVLYQDDGMIFFKERYATISEGVNNGIVQRDATLRHRSNYFISQGEGQIAKVKLKKKDVFSSFIEDEVYAMKEYAKKKGIKFSSEQDYVEVFEGVAAND